MDRRSLRFDRLEDAVAEAERLMGGHRVAGRWSLGQALYHLTATILGTSRPVSGPAPSRFDPIGSMTRAWFFLVGRIPAGVALPRPELDPPPDADAARNLDRLARAIDAFQRSTGPYPSHPILGHLTKGQWLKFHQIHCAHHLSHLIPLDRGGTGDGVAISREK